MTAVLICGAALALVLVAEKRGWRGGIWCAKPVAAGAFVAAAIGWGGLDSLYGRWVVAGLALSWWGDVLLIPKGHKGWFLAGLTAFLLGHVAYCGAFARLPLAPGWLLAGGLTVTGLLTLVLIWLTPHLTAALRWPVRAYIAVIGCMVCLALGAYGGGAPWPVPVGAVGFAVSDLAVARDRFIQPGFVNRIWGLPLYFAAQLLLAWSVSWPA